MREWSFFDCDVMIGRSTVPIPDEIVDTTALLHQMDRYGIDQALFYVRSAGTDKAMREAAGSDRLELCYVVPMGLAGPDDKLEDHVNRMLDLGARAARFVIETGPSAPPLLIKPFLLEALYEKLERHRIPLLLDGGGLHTPAAAHHYGIEDIDAVCAQFPNLPVILLRTHRSLQSILVLLTRKHKNLYFTHALMTLGHQLEDVAELAGADRIVFGSQVPYWEPSLPIGMLNHAEMPAAAKKLIAGDNLRRLLANVS